MGQVISITDGKEVLSPLAIGSYVQLAFENPTSGIVFAFGDIIDLTKTHITIDDQNFGNITRRRIPQEQIIERFA